MRFGRRLLQWRYCIRIENVGELNTQLRERHWRIFSLSGTLETVRMSTESITGELIIMKLRVDSGILWFV